VKQLKKVDKPSDVLEDLNCALVCAAETNNMTLVNLFLESGANKDCYSKDGRTPMMEAARQGHVNMLEFLLQCGADVSLSFYLSGLIWRDIE
jgi:ankyrin repeat protein